MVKTNKTTLYLRTFNGKIFTEFPKKYEESNYYLLRFIRNTPPLSLVFTSPIYWVSYS